MAVGPPPPPTAKARVTRDAAYYRALSDELDTMIDRMVFIAGELRNLSFNMAAKE
jgi:hypothetical protein